MSFPVCSHPGTEELGLQAGRQQEQKRASTNLLQLPTSETAQPQAPLSLIQQQDELQGQGCCRDQKLCWVKWCLPLGIGSCRRRVCVAESLPEPVQFRKGEI